MSFGSSNNLGNYTMIHHVINKGCYSPHYAPNEKPICISCGRSVDGPYQKSITENYNEN